MKDAQRAAKDILLSGYRHHSYEDELHLRKAFMSLNEHELNKLLDSHYLSSILEKYAEILGPTRLRSSKNGLICLLASISRSAIEFGVDSEFSFALSDYYINEVEKCRTENETRSLMRKIIRHYHHLAQSSQSGAYSRYVSLAVRYINSCIYQKCSTGLVAKHIGLKASYIAPLFKKEVGMTITEYIKKKKMEEALRMLTDGSFSISEIADALGYYDAAYFSNAYKRYYNKTPISEKLGTQKAQKR